MKGIRDWSNGFIFVLGLCVIIGGLFTSGCSQGGDDVAIAAPSAPSNPNPTTDLSGITQNWDKNLPSASRFTVLAAFNNEAVRDNNTGLVWEKAPDSTPYPWHDVTSDPNIRQATSVCLFKSTGGVLGWRLPSIVELLSLHDASLGSVFSNVQSGNYWSATTTSEVSTFAHIATPQGGYAGSHAKTVSHFVWCVRGPMQESVY